MRQNFERMKKPKREYNELKGERLAKDFNLDIRKRQWRQVKQWTQMVADN